MGYGFLGKCRNCGNKEQLSIGGGFFFHRLHCDRCGKGQDIAFEKLGDLHDRYVKGLGGPYTVISMERDREIQENAAIEPLSRGEYHRGIEALLPPCKCGGHLSMAAPPRCSKCGSADIEDTKQMAIYYD